MSAMISVPFPKSWRGHRVDNISIQEEMLKENQMGDSRIFPPDSANYMVVLGHLIEKSPYCRVLRKYEQQIGRVAAQNPQVSSALARICAGRAKTCAPGNTAHATIKQDLFVLNCFLEFIYFATDEVIRELSGDPTTAV